MTILLFTIAASLAALIGGYIAIRNRNNLQITMAITSGLVLGLVAFGLLPEVFEGADATGIDPIWVMVLFVVGFMFFHAIEKLTMVHHSDETSYQEHDHSHLGIARALALIGHSLLDGLSIGVAFQINPTVGYSVALAVIGHRFADGFDTASFMLFSGNKLSRVKQLLLLVVIMPVVGGLLSFALPLSELALTLYLGFFAGLLMYIAAGSILPQAHSKDRSKLLLVLTLAGAGFMFVMTQLV